MHVGSIDICCPMESALSLRMILATSATVMTVFLTLILRPNAEQVLEKNSMIDCNCSEKSWGPVSHHLQWERVLISFHRLGQCFACFRGLIYKIK